VSSLSREAPWPGLASFTEQDAAFFHGREIETLELFRLIRRGAVTLLFGKSGLGKTSLLNAGLFPLLQDSGFAPIYVRLDHGENAAPLADQVQQAVAARLPRPQEPTLWESFHRREDETGHRALPVIVLDQFEEIFTLGRENIPRRSRSTAFFTQLADLIQNNCPAEAQERFDQDRDARRRYDFDKQEFRILISMREEYLAFLEESRQPLRPLLPQRLRLVEMNGTQALEAITKAGGHLFEAGVGEGIVRFVAGADAREDMTGASLDDLEIAPALLSLICAELNDHRRRTNSPTISEQLLSGRRDEILRGFYDRCFIGLDREVRVFVEEQLLTTSGYRDSMATEDAVRLMGVTVDAIDTLVVRRLLRVDRRAGTSRVEITHDILIAPCRRSRDLRHVKEQGWWAKVLSIAASTETLFIFVILGPFFVLSIFMSVVFVANGIIMDEWAVNSDDLTGFVIMAVHMPWCIAVLFKLRIWNWIVKAAYTAAWAVLGLAASAEMCVTYLSEKFRQVWTDHNFFEFSGGIAALILVLYIIVIPCCLMFINLIQQAKTVFAHSRITPKTSLP